MQLYLRNLEGEIIKLINIYQKFFNKGILSTKCAFIRWLWWKRFCDETDGNKNKSLNMIIKYFGNFRLLVHYLQLYYVKQEISANWNELKTIQTNKNQKLKETGKAKLSREVNHDDFKNIFFGIDFQCSHKWKIQWCNFDVLIFWFHIIMD